MQMQVPDAKRVQVVAADQQQPAQLDEKVNPAQAAEPKVAH
jgi:hypothetical protein